MAYVADRGANCQPVLPMRLLRTASTLLFLVPIVLVAQTTTPATTAFLTTIGRDTFCLEQYRRAGNVISGSWVVLHPPGVYVHDFQLTLANDGLPLRYTMKYSTPGAPTPPDLDSLTVAYGSDSATVQFYQRDSSFTRRIAIHEGFPLLGQSFVGLELAMMRLRKMHLDSSIIALHPPSDPSGRASLVPVRFVADDSVLVAGAIRARVAADGSILGLRSGPLELRRVDAFEMSRIVDGFVKAFAPRVAAQAAAAASRVEISLAASQLDRFIGNYSIGTVTIAISRDGEHLMLHLPQHSAIQLLAMSTTQFFAKKPDLLLAFESDSAGRVTGLTVQQLETKQRFVRSN
jgi:hypothetical protein